MAIIVVANRDRSVIAHLGSADWESRRLDLSRRPRSPGSALKPFVYALAFDDMALHPGTLVEDASVRFGDWSPRNFDLGFHGMVTVREALQRSLNVPAVLALQKAGPGRMAATLADVGAPLVLPKGAAPRLPLALGGGAIAPIDLAMLYASLSNGGQVQALSWHRDQPPSPPAAWSATWPPGQSWTSSKAPLRRTDLPTTTRSPAARSPIRREPRTDSVTHGQPAPPPTTPSQCGWDSPMAPPAPASSVASPQRLCCSVSSICCYRMNASTAVPTANTPCCAAPLRAHWNGSGPQAPSPAVIRRASYFRLTVQLSRRWPRVWRYRPREDGRRYVGWPMGSHCREGRSSGSRRAQGSTDW
jgi:hypothetical protein